MKTLHTHNEEMEKKFDKDFPWLYGEEEHKVEIKNFITNQNKQLYIKIAEGELELLKNKKRPTKVGAKFFNGKKVLRELDLEKQNQNIGFNKALGELTSHWNNILQELNK